MNEKLAKKGILLLTVNYGNNKRQGTLMKKVFTLTGVCCKETQF